MNQCKCKKRGISHFISSFGYSLSGLKTALTETAIRQELCLGVLHVFAVVFVPVSLVMKVILSALWGAIIITELINTAIESIVDLASPDYHELAKRAKDLGSAAVFCALVTYFSTWVVALVRI